MGLTRTLALALALALTLPPTPTLTLPLPLPLSPTLTLTRRCSRWAATAWCAAGGPELSSLPARSGAARQGVWVRVDVCGGGGGVAEVYHDLSVVCTAFYPRGTTIVATNC